MSDLLARLAGMSAERRTYTLNSLARHLSDGKKESQLTRLFEDNAWMQARFEGSGYVYDGYVDDLMLAWQMAHQELLRQIEAGLEPGKLAACVRYALIRTSINSLSMAYAPELVAAAVVAGSWNVDRALSVAASIPDAGGQVEMLAAILATSVLSGQRRVEAQQQALDAALRLPATARDEATDTIGYPLSDGLQVLVPVLDGEILEGALDALLKSAYEDAYPRTRVLETIEAPLSPALVERLTAYARSLSRPFDRAMAFLALLPNLTATDRVAAVSAILECLPEIDNEQGRVTMLVWASSYLAGQHLGQALEVAREVEFPQARSRALLALSGQLPEGPRHEMLTEAWDVALKIELEGMLIEMLARLIPSHPDQDEAREYARAVLESASEWNLVEALEPLVPWLDNALLSTALEQAYQQEGEIRARALGLLAPALAGEQQRQLFETVLAEVPRYKSDAGRQRSILVALAPHLHGAPLTTALGLARSIEDEAFRAEVLVAMAPRLEGDLMTLAVESALAVENTRYRGRALASLIEGLDDQEKGTIFARGLRPASPLREPQELVAALEKMAPHLDESAIKRVLDTAFALDDGWRQVAAIERLAPYLSSGLSEGILERNVGAGNDWAMVVALGKVVPYLTDEFRAEALARALSIAATYQDDHRVHGQMLAALIPHLPEAEQGPAVEKALQDLLTLDSDGPMVNERAALLRDLLPYLLAERRRELLAEEWQLVLASEEPEALTTLAPHVPAEEARQALAQAWNKAMAESWDYASWVLPWLAPYVDPSLIPSAVDDVLSIAQPWIQADVLSALAPRLTSEDRQRIVSQVPALEGQWNRAIVLAALAGTDTAAQALTVAHTLTDPGARAFALATFLPVAAGGEALLKAIRRTVAEQLLQLQDRGLHRLLQFISNKHPFERPILDAQVLGAIGDHLLEIGCDWQWL